MRYFLTTESGSALDEIGDTDDDVMFYESREPAEAHARRLLETGHYNVLCISAEVARLSVTRTILTVEAQ